MNKEDEMPEVLLPGVGKVFTANLPGESIFLPWPALSEEERSVQAMLERHVLTLSDEIGVRNVRHWANYEKARDYIENVLGKLGHGLERQEFKTGGRVATNMSVLIEGRAGLPELVVAAHYDTVDCPGANDNASGIAALLEIARYSTAQGQPPERSIRIVALANEEPPYFQSGQMGSLVYARSLRARQRELLGMICLETIGYYSEAEGTQDVPSNLKFLYTNNRGNFVGIFGNSQSIPLLEALVNEFRRNTAFPVEGIAAPAHFIPFIDLSDKWSFYEAGYQAVMVTDTVMYRYKHYHLPSDTWEKLTYEPFAMVTLGLAKAVWGLANP
jgi:hypothetical protein